MKASAYPYDAGARRSRWHLPLTSLWTNRTLIQRLAVRDLQSRYRGSMLGITWAVLVPLGMVLMYTFVFGSIFKARWAGISGSTENMTAFFLAGLIVHQFLSESVGRASSLVLDNQNYVTKVVFPLEVLAVVTVEVALAGAAIGLVLLLGLTALTSGLPATALLSPLVLIAMIPMLVGLVWIISALGVFVRDLGQIMPVLLSVLMFLGPVVYPRSAVPEPFGTLMLLNPITIPAETLRALIFGHPFPAAAAAIYIVASLAVCYLGFLLFARLRMSFADVL